MTPSLACLSPTARPSRITRSLFGLGLLCGLLSFSGCLGRDYDGELGRITIPEKGAPARERREVVLVPSQREPGAAYGLRYRDQRGGRWTGGNWTSGGRGTWGRGTWGRGTWGRGTWGRGTSSRGTWGRGTGAWATGPRGTGPRGTWSRGTGGQRLTAGDPYSGSRWDPRWSRRPMAGRGTQGADSSEPGARTTRGDDGPRIRYRYRGTQR